MVVYSFIWISSYRGLGAGWLFGTCIDLFSLDMELTYIFQTDMSFIIYSAWLYVTKEDREVLHSPGHH